MLASQTRKTITINEESYGIRALSWKSLEKAREARNITNAQSMRAYGGDVLKGLRSDTVSEVEKLLQAEKESVEAKRKARYDAHDRGQVLTAGVSSLPMPGKLEELIPELDERTAVELHEAILDLSLPPIDAAGAAAAEAAGKGASGASTSS